MSERHCDARDAAPLSCPNADVTSVTCSSTSRCGKGTEFVARQFDEQPGSFSPAPAFSRHIRFQETLMMPLVRAARDGACSSACSAPFSSPSHAAERDFLSRFEGSFSGGGTVQRNAQGESESGHLHLDRAAFRDRRLDERQVRRLHLLKADQRQAPLRSSVRPLQRHLYRLLDRPGRPFRQAHAAIRSC